MFRGLKQEKIDKENDGIQTMHDPIFKLGDILMKNLHC